MKQFKPEFKLNKPILSRTKLLLALSIFGFTPIIQASPTQTNMAVETKALDYTANLNYIHQSSSDRDLVPSNTLSADLTVTYQASSSILWNLHIEAASTQNNHTVSKLIADSNADAGSAEDEANQGRIQVSEFFIQKTFNANNQITAGLVDATAFLDSSSFANDENMQFITSSLVNNPVIDFPDYVLGFAYQHQFSETIGSTLFISSTHGLSDNAAHSYSNLFEVRDDQKGIFSALETQFNTAQLEIKSGIWLHNGEHEALNDSTQKHLFNYGVYVNIDKSIQKHGFSMRLGASNPKVATTDQFFSLAYQYANNDDVFGLGYSQTFQSDYIQGTSIKNPQVIEAYWNKNLGKNWSVTPSIQMFKNPQIDDETLYIESDSIYNTNVRLTYNF
jgi:hypothetical protein